MPVHTAARKLYGSLYHFSLFENIGLFYETSLLACNCFQIWGGWVKISLVELCSTKI
jgi:hypothetical protein